MPASARRIRRLLSLDGGGVRGLSIIMILEEIMKRVNRGLGPGEELQPWETFDMIGGTSTGGIIALMLGRLRMSLQECRRAYLELSATIFLPKRGTWDIGRRTVDFLQANGRFDSEVFEDAIKATIRDHSIGMAADSTSDNILLEDAESPCKVFVCTVRGENSEPAFLRTFENPVTADALSKDFKVWEACRATSAATTFFEPYVHAEYGQKFIDGGLQYNNPVMLVLQEAKDMWPDDEVMLISVGTGNAPGQKFGGNLATIAKGLKSIATETEKTAKMFHRSHQNMVQDNRYFRFNVPGMASIGLQEHKEIPSIASASQTYLEDSETGQKLRYCTTEIVESLKEERLKFSVEVERECLTFLSFGGMDAREQNVEPAFDSTCNWIRDHRVYQNWFTSNHGLLWISGKPGSGKSTLIKQSLDFARDDVPKGSPVASFFFNLRSGLPLESSPLGMFRALLCQMLEQRQSQEPFEELLGKFCKKKERHRTNDWQWQLAEVKASFRAVMNHPASPPMYLYIDALDECNENQARELTTFFNQIILESPSLHICISTRHTPYLAYESHLQICMEYENNGDITTYVQGRLRDSMTKGQKFDLSKKLVRKASGVFLWIDLVLKMLISALDMGATEAELKETLDAFPVELGKLFQSMLDKIPSRNWPAARQLMQWVLYAERPLTTKELRYALAFSRKPTYHSIASWEASPDFIGDDAQMEKRITGLTWGLVEVGRSTRASRVGPRRRYGRENGQLKPLGAPSSKVQFVHQSVKDFLVEGNVLAEGHEMLMRSCVAYLATPEVQLSAVISPGDEFETFTGVEDSTWVSWPTFQVSFLNYAVNMCFVHAQKAETLEKVLVAPFLEQFYIPSDIMFQRWRQLYDQYRIRLPREQQGSKATLLHIAAEFRIKSLLEQLLDKGKKVNEQGGKYGNALQAAAILGFNDIVAILLKQGADIKMRGKYDKALYGAAYGGNPETVLLLLQNGAEVNEIGGPDGTALQVALHEGHIATVKVLVQNGANLKQRVFEGQTPLLWSIQAGCTISMRKYIPLQMQQDLENTHVAMIQYLLAQDAALEEKDEYGRTALLLAVSRRHIPLVRLLVQYGANIEARDRYYGRTPLLLAASAGGLPLFQTLLSQNADIEARDDHGQTALMLAASSGHLPIVELLATKGATMESIGGFTGERTALGAAVASGRKEVTKFLLEAGAPLETKSGKGSTALITAAAFGHRDIVMILLDQGAEIDASNNDGETPLLAAVKAQSQRIEYLSLEATAQLQDVPEKDRRKSSAVARALKHIILLLISRGANVCLQDIFGGNALYYSASGGHILTTRFLLDYGADPKAVNPRSNLSPLQIASKKEHNLVKRLLLRKLGEHAETKQIHDRQEPELPEQTGNIPVEKVLEKSVNTNHASAYALEGHLSGPRLKNVYRESEKGDDSHARHLSPDNVPSQELWFPPLAIKRRRLPQDLSPDFDAEKSEDPFFDFREMNEKEDNPTFSKVNAGRPMDSVGSSSAGLDAAVTVDERLSPPLAPSVPAENSRPSSSSPQPPVLNSALKDFEPKVIAPPLDISSGTLSGQNVDERGSCIANDDDDFVHRQSPPASPSLVPASGAETLDAPTELDSRSGIIAHVILLLGAAKVGKSSLIRQIGENKNSTAEDWWTRHLFSYSGNCKLREISTLALLENSKEPPARGWSLMLVFDVGSSLSFHFIEQKERFISTWRESQVAKPFIVLIGNKADIQENEREVSTKCAENLCKLAGWKYVETSAWYADRGCHELDVIMNKGIEQYNSLRFSTSRTTCNDGKTERVGKRKMVG